MIHPHGRVLGGYGDGLGGGLAMCTKRQVDICFLSFLFSLVSLCELGPFLLPFWSHIYTLLFFRTCVSKGSSPSDGHNR